MFNRRIKAWFTWKKPPATPAVAPAEATAVASTTAADSTATRPPVSGITTADRPADQPRRRRRRRREPSPTGLPLYAEEPHDDEMSLFKHEGPSAGSRVDLRDLSYGGSSQGHGDDGESSLYRPSMDASSTTDLHFGRSRSASDARSLNQSLFAYPATPPRRSSDFTNDPATSFSRPGTHRSTHSSPALSPPSPPIASSGRARSSTLRSIFTRNGSSSMLSSSPGAVSGSGRSPYGQGGNGSTSRLASASSASISSQSISAPLQHTLVSSSFIFPKSGPTASQIAFISSRESLGAYGYGDGVAQIPGYEEGSSPASEPAPITSSSMAVPVVGGRFRASSVSSQLSIASSPLARTVSAPEPASPTTDDSEGVHHLPLPTDPPIPSYDELHPPSPTESPSPPSPPSPPPIMTLTLPPPLSFPIPTDNSPSSTPINSAFATPRSHSPSPGNGSVAHTPKTGNPPILPALVFYNATPTASAAPSPIVPGGAYDDERIPTRREQNFSTISEASFMSQGSWATAPSVSAEADRDD